VDPIGPTAGGRSDRRPRLAPDDAAQSRGVRRRRSQCSTVVHGAPIYRV